jgi:hypothetical protein
MTDAHKCELFLLSLPLELEDGITTRFRAKPEEEHDWESLTRVYEEKIDRLSHHNNRATLQHEEGVAVIFNKDGIHRQARRTNNCRNFKSNRPANGNGNSNNYGNSNTNKDVTCFWCHNKGHRMDNCGARRRGQPKKTPPIPAAAAAASILSAHGRIGAISAIIEATEPVKILIESVATEPSKNGATEPVKSKKKATEPVKTGATEPSKISLFKTLKKMALTATRPKPSTHNCHWCKDTHRHKDCHMDRHKPNRSGHLANIAEVALHANPVTTDTILVDSGATHNIVGNASLLQDIKPLNSPREFKLAGTRFTMTATHSGCLTVHGKGGSALIKDVYHCPDTTDNIISTPQLRSQGWLLNLDKMQLSRNGITFPLTETPTGRPCLVQPKPAQLAAQEPDAEDTEETQPEPFDSPLYRIHQRLGHLGRTTLLNIIKSGIFPDMSITYEEAKDDPFTTNHCDNCLAGRSTRFPHLGASLRGSAQGEVLHLDLKGPMAKSRLHSKFWLAAAADYTRFRYGISLENKSAEGVQPEIVDIVNLIERQSGIPIKVIRTDHGGEFVNDAFKRFCRNKGIQHHVSPPYMHELNGVAERLNRTLAELIRAMLDGCALGHVWWDYALLHACNVLNSTTLCEDGRTAWEIIYHRKPKFATMWRFGEICYAVINSPQSKAEFTTVRAYKARILCRDTDSSTWQVRRESDGKICTASEIRKAEGHDIMEPLAKIPAPEDSIPLPAAGESAALTAFPDIDAFLCPDPLAPGLLASAAAEDAEAEPLTIQEAAASGDWPQWYDAILAEIDNLETKGTWSETQLPSDRKAITAKWVFKRKRDQDGKVVKFKARLVARGFTQVPGVDFEDVTYRCVPPEWGRGVTRDTVPR